MVIPADMMLQSSCANRTSSARRHKPSPIAEKILGEPTGLAELVLFYANVLPGSATMSDIRIQPAVRNGEAPS